MAFYIFLPVKLPKGNLIHKAIWHISSCLVFFKIHWPWIYSIRYVPVQRNVRYLTGALVWKQVSYYLPYQMFSTVKRCIHTKFGWIWSSDLSASNKFSFKSVENWNFAGPQKKLVEITQTLSSKSWLILNIQKKF